VGGQAAGARGTWAGAGAGDSGLGEPGAQLRHLRGNRRPRGPALRLPPLHRRLVVPHAARARLGLPPAQCQLQAILTHANRTSSEPCAACSAPCNHHYTNASSGQDAPRRRQRAGAACAGPPPTACPAYSPCAQEQHFSCAQIQAAEKCCKCRQECKARGGAWGTEGTGPLLGHLDHGAGHVMRLAEGHPLAHQVVREVRRQHRQVQRLHTARTHSCQNRQTRDQQVLRASCITHSNRLKIKDISRRF
jgi:hypothetical protein